MIAELKQDYVERERRYTEMVREGHENLSSLFSEGRLAEFGDALDGMRFAEVALQVLEELPKPGRTQGKKFARAGDQALADECLAKSLGNEKAAKKAFIAKVASEMSEQARKNGSADETARKRWYAATGPVGNIRRPRQK